MQIHVALGHVLVMLEAEGLIESVAIRGEAEIKAVCRRISFEPESLYSRAMGRPRWNRLFSSSFSQ
jgi:hypothetical protein